jgi:hypothetical protein
MVQPYDYSLGTPSTTESFLAGVQSYQNQQKVDAARAAAQADQAKVDRARLFSSKAQAVAQDPKPENLSALYAEFPEAIKRLKKLQQFIQAVLRRQETLIAQTSQKNLMLLRRWRSIPI